MVKSDLRPLEAPHTRYLSCSGDLYHLGDLITNFKICLRVYFLSFSLCLGAMCVCVYQLTCMSVRSGVCVCMYLLLCLSEGEAEGEGTEVRGVGMGH